MANCLASADTCWLCSLHHSQHLWWPSQPSCHPCHYCHWSHFIPKRSGLYLCSDLWSLLWNADGGEVTYPICWLPSILFLDAFPCYCLLPSCCLMISQQKFICSSLSSMRICHYVHFPYLRHHFCLNQTCASASRSCYMCGAWRDVHAPVSCSWWVLHFCRQVLCQVLMWAWAIMELAVSLGAPMSQWVGLPLQEGIHRRAYNAEPHAWLCTCMQLTALLDPTTSSPESAVSHLISSFLHLACSHSVSDTKVTKASRRQPIGPHSSGKGQQGVECHDHACNVWCRNAVWLGDSDDLCTGVSGVCCGCWGALLWQLRPICCWSLPVFYGLCRSALSLLPLRQLQYCLTTASPFHAKKQVLDQHLHYDLLLSNLALHNSHTQ